MKLAAVLLVAAALPARAQGLGLTVEAQGGLVIAPDGRGSASAPAGGARLGLDVLEPAPFLLRAELSWLRFGRSAGTDAVRVSPTFDELLLGLRAGWQLGRPHLVFQPYVLAGPVLAIVSSTYAIADPLGATSSPGATGADLGVGYGVGLALLAGGGPGLRFASRLEAARLHRGAAADLALQLSAGVAF